MFIKIDEFIDFKNSIKSINPLYAIQLVIKVSQHLDVNWYIQNFKSDFENDKSTVIYNFISSYTIPMFTNKAGFGGDKSVDLKFLSNTTRNNFDDDIEYSCVMIPNDENRIDFVRSFFEYDVFEFN